MDKTLIFGGAFDPPHTQHIEIAHAAMVELGISRLVIVPTYMPPHKGSGTLSFEDRVTLAKAAFGEGAIIDTIERDRHGVNYACFVLDELKQKYGDIVYLIGGDSLMYLDTWHDPKRLLSICPIAVAARDKFDDIGAVASDLSKRFGGKFLLLKYKGRDVSSSRIKAELLLGEKPDDVPQTVMDAICAHGFFRQYDDMVAKLRSFETPELYEHSKAVVKLAVELNSLHNLKQDFDKVFVAALLHDNAKQRPSVDGLAVPDDAVGTPVLHQFLGAEKARRDFGVTDGEALDAIRYHTTARPDMTTLEKLIYTADSLSYDRTYEPIPKLRQIALNDFEKGFEAVLRFTYDKLAAKGRPMYPLTEAAYKFYLPN